MKQREQAYAKMSSDITKLQTENAQLLDENNSLIQRIVNAITEIRKATDYLNELRNSTQENPDNRALLNAIEQSIQDISNYMNGSNGRVVGGKKSRKNRKSRKSRKSRKRKCKKQKGGFLYKTHSNRKSLRSSANFKR
jgi:cell division septum initiation protein DivIVA